MGDLLRVVSGEVRDPADEPDLLGLAFAHSVH
jgi:hypothetical protein